MLYYNNINKTIQGIEAMYANMLQYTPHTYIPNKQGLLLKLIKPKYIFARPTISKSTKYYYRYCITLIDWLYK